MPNLVASKMFRLFGVSEHLDEGSQYKLMPLDVDAFNEDIAESDVEDTLKDLAGILYDQDCCGADWHEITDNMRDDGTVSIEIGSNDCLEIQNIIDLIDVDAECSRFFVVVNGTRSDYLWIVAVPQGTVYAG